MFLTYKAVLWEKLKGAQCSELVKSRVPSMWFVMKKVGKDHFLILWIEKKKMIFRLENWTVKKFQERHFSKGLVHGFCPKIELFSFGFFWCYKLRQKRFLFLYSSQTRMILDQKVNVLKGAKNRHFRKGIIHGFCPKIILFIIYLFWDEKSR